MSAIGIPTVPLMGTLVQVSCTGSAKRTWAQRGCIMAEQQERDVGSESRRASYSFMDTIMFKAIGLPPAYAYRKHSKAPCGEDAKSTTFDKKEHRKYLGKYCFKEEKKSREPIADAVRDSDSKQAYYDFLEGLQQINQQEYLDPEKIGKVVNGKEPGIWDRFMDAIGLGKEDKATEHLRKLAMWEREMRRRANAFQTQLFANDLRHRAQMGLDAEPEHDEHNDKMPIRPETYEMLTRQPEQDFTFMGALVYIINILVSAYTLYTQIRILTDVCPVSFMCPFQRATAGKPILAPPVAFRMGAGTTAVGERAYINSYQPWNAKLKPLCSISQDDGCEGGGYLIQWPYVQAETGKRGIVPPELLSAGCEIIDGLTTSGGNDGWVYNHYEQEVIPKYLRCPADKDTIPFVTPFTVNSTQGISEFTYEPAFYESNHDRTLDCMKDTLKEMGADGAEIKDWPQATRNRRGDALSYMRSCMTQSAIAHGDKCNCGLKNWEKFAIGLFYADETTSSCSESGLWCKPETQQRYEQLQLDISRLEAAGEVTSDAIQNLRETYESQPDAFLCPQDETCERAYKNEQPLNTAQRFGCYFDSEYATEPLRPDFYSCTGAYMWGSDSKYRGMTPQQRMKQEALDMAISKRAMLIAFFLIKEGTIFTAKAMQFAVFVATLVLFLVFYALFLWPLKRLVPESVVAVNAGVVAAKDGVLSFVSLLETLCLSLSTVYRTLIKANQVRLGLVNPSIRDMNDKITSLANTVFSLAVLMTLEDSGESGIVASLVLTLTQLIFQMVLEKMKLQHLERPLRDMNENRLSKFEVALLWVKIMEDFLSDDVQYNWVQIFHSKALLKPFDLTFPETLQPKDDDWYTADAHKQHEDPNDTFLRKWFQSLVHVDQDKLTYSVMVNSLSPELRWRFGHDGYPKNAHNPYPPGIFDLLKYPWHNQPVKKSVHLEDIPEHDVKSLAIKKIAGTDAKHCRVKFAEPGTEEKLLTGTWVEGLWEADAEAGAKYCGLDKAFAEQDMFEFQPSDHVYPDVDGPPNATNAQPRAARAPGGRNENNGTAASGSVSGTRQINTQALPGWMEKVPVDEQAAGNVQESGIGVFNMVQDSRFAAVDNAQDSGVGGVGEESGMGGVNRAQESGTAALDDGQQPGGALVDNDAVESGVGGVDNVQPESDIGGLGTGLA